MSDGQILRRIAGIVMGKGTPAERLFLIVGVLIATGILNSKD